MTLTKRLVAVLLAVVAVSLTGWQISRELVDLTDVTAKTGTGTVVVMQTSPSLVTPALGTPASGVLTNVTGYPGDSSLVTLGTVTTGTWSATDIGVAAGGTGASDAATARTNLGLAIGSDVLGELSQDSTPQLGGALDGQGNDLNNLGVLFLTEQVAAEIDVAGKGQIWVKTATPNQLWFTDDAGTDLQLGVVGANTALSNLAAVAVNLSLTSDTDITDDLGTGEIRWKDLHAATVNAGTTAADTLLIRGYDTDTGPVYVDVLTITSGATVTADLAAITTIGGNAILDATSTVSALTTVGTIDTGVWQGTAIGDAYLTKTGDWTGTLDGSEGAALLARANHTGTQLASTISDLAATANETSYATGVFGLADDLVMPGNASATLVTGSTAQEPAAGDGKIRYDSDTNRLRISQGTTPLWRDATNWFDIRDYGAIEGAAGGNQAANTTAIQAAIDASELTGGMVFVPEGTWEHNGGLTTDAGNVTLAGAGVGSILENIQTVGATDSYTIENRDYWVIRDIQIKGNASSGIGIVANNTSSNGRMSGVFVNQHGSHGLSMATTADVGIDISQCWFHSNGGSGINAVSSSTLQINALTIRGCLVFGNTSDGITFNGTSMLVSGNTIESNVGAGIHLDASGTDGTEAVAIQGNYFEANTDGAVKISARNATDIVKNVLITGNYLLSNVVGGATALIYSPTSTAADIRDITITNNTWSIGGATVVDHVNFNGNARQVTIISNQDTDALSLYAGLGTDSRVILNGTQYFGDATDDGVKLEVLASHSGLPISVTSAGGTLGDLFQVEGDGRTTIARRTASTSGAIHASTLQADSTGASISSGFGPRQFWKVSDTGASNLLGYQECTTDGADNTGQFQFAVYVGGVATSKLFVSQQGLQLGTGTSPSGTATKVLTLGDNAGDPTFGAGTSGLWRNGTDTKLGDVNPLVVSDAGEVEFQASAHFGTVVANVISANAATIDLSAANDQTLDLAAATGAVTITLTAPPGACAGKLWIKQDATARDITWVSGTGITLGRWMGAEPTWSSDTANLYRVVSWLFDGTDLFLSVTAEQTATF